MIENPLENLIVMLPQKLLKRLTDKFVLHKVQVKPTVQKNVVVQMNRKLYIKVLKIVHQVL